MSDNKTQSIIDTVICQTTKRGQSIIDTVICQTTKRGQYKSNYKQNYFQTKNADNETIQCQKGNTIYLTI